MYKISYVWKRAFDVETHYFYRVGGKTGERKTRRVKKPVREESGV